MQKIGYLNDKIPTKPFSTTKEIVRVKLIYVGKNPKKYRPWQPALVLARGEYRSLYSSEAQLCFKVRYLKDGRVVYLPVRESKDYFILKIVK
jgi:hypothetical protein